MFLFLILLVTFGPTHSLTLKLCVNFVSFLETPQVVTLNYPLPVNPEWLPTCRPAIMIKLFRGILQSVREIFKILQNKQLKSQQMLSHSLQFITH